MDSTGFGRVLFLVQRFDTKTLSDSAGLIEIANPMLQSGLVDDYKIHSWAKGNDFWSDLIARQIDEYVSLLKQKPITVYGGGAHTLDYWDQYSQLNVTAIADKQSEKWGSSLKGIQIISPDEITTDVIIISSRAWEKSIKVELESRFPDKTILTIYESAQAAIEDCNTQALSELELDALSEFDLVVYTPAEPAEALSEKQLTWIKQATQATLMCVWWDYDDTSQDNVYIDFEKATLSQADLILDPGNFTRVKKVQEKSFPYQDYIDTHKITLLPTPVDSRIFHPRIEKEIDIGSFGSKVGLRERWISCLENAFPQHFTHVGGVGAGQSPIPMPLYAEKAGKSRIIVNSQTYSFRTQCKGKVREALASGALLVEEACYDTREFIQSAPFVRFFSTPEELIEIVEYYLSHEEERAELARQAHDWYQKNWSAKPWAEKLLAALNEI